MSYTEKVNVLDLLIEVLTDHENKLDKQVSSLEPLIEHLEVEASVSKGDLDDDQSLVDAFKDVKRAASMMIRHWWMHLRM